MAQGSGTSPTHYAAAGVLLGVGFSLAALLVLAWTGRFPMEAGLGAALAQVHRTEPLLYIIHCAPFVLGLFAWLVGQQQARIRRFSSDMEAQVEAKTRDLQQALEETRRANETILHLAEHDSLTGLLNRTRIQKDLDRWADHARRYHREVALMFVDLDGFKRVNDEHGHAVGDEYLRGVAARVRDALRATDAIGRWGGDEFAVVLPETSAAQAGEAANKLLEAFGRAPIAAGGREWLASASIGIAAMPTHTVDPDELAAFADAAMYQAKAAGGGAWRVYAGSLDEAERSQEGVRWEARLRRALAAEQFVIHYQPVMELATRVTPGYEALLRMEERDGTLVQPRLFLGYAEQFNLAPAIDRMVIRKAARRVAGLAAQGVDVWVSVNLSRKTLCEEDLPMFVHELIEECAIRASQIAFEVDEGMAALQESITARQMQALRALGCRVVLDDFGLGLSALYALERLRVDLVKLDARLARNLDQAGGMDLIVRLTEAAHKAGARVVVKCVEDPEHVHALREGGVDYVQGFAVGIPIEAVDRAQHRA